ncbi:MAG: PAS domain-containing protein, partial [Candidatus Eremiobacteraeota bacterium]|nr:PAS domain-containing protein [Candidatus Eremiobacteraeota bacterium]
MAELIARMDWSQHPLGPLEQWPQSLQTALSICLHSRQSLIVWWGPELRILYNDAFRVICGDKHPESMGSPGRLVWPEIWHIIGPMLESVLAGGPATWEHDQLLVLNRHDFLEEAYFTYSYSAIRDETGKVGGVFTATTETTERVLRARRLSTLKELGRAPARASTAEACQTAMGILASNPLDLPFVQIYVPRGS